MLQAWIGCQAPAAPPRRSGRRSRRPGSPTARFTPLSLIPASRVSPTSGGTYRLARSTGPGMSVMRAKVARPSTVGLVRVDRVDRPALAQVGPHRLVAVFVPGAGRADHRDRGHVRPPLPRRPGRRPCSARPPRCTPTQLPSGHSGRDGSKPARRRSRPRRVLQPSSASLVVRPVIRLAGATAARTPPRRALAALRVGPPRRSGSGHRPRSAPRSRRRGTAVGARDRRPRGRRCWGTGGEGGWDMIQPAI